MEPDAPQLGNVANRGDIIKHVALVGLLRALGPTIGRLLYVETHAFRPEATLSDDRVRAWTDATSTGLPKSAAAREYIELERASLARGRYLCSVGLAKAVLRATRVGRTDCVLCEAGADSRRLLAASLWNATILTDNALLEHSLTPRAGLFDAVFIHVDPYRLTDSETLFAAWLEGAKRAAKDVAPVVALVFDYENKGWPKEPVPGMRLIGTTSLPPFFLAAYGNAEGRRVCLDPLRAGGWSLTAARPPKNQGPAHGSALLRVPSGPRHHFRTFVMHKTIYVIHYICYYWRR